ncbi:MAG: hypothetical protein R3C53_16085 [Pirellulaceae bacterium]
MEQRNCFPRRIHKADLYKTESHANSYTQSHDFFDIPPNGLVPTFAEAAPEAAMLFNLGMFPPAVVEVSVFGW